MFLHRDSKYILAYDLSVGSNASCEMFLIPRARFGPVTVRTSFSQPTPVDITMCCFAEYPSQLQVTEAKQVGFTYWDPNHSK